jgi:hypothetical protein
LSFLSPLPERFALASCSGKPEHTQASLSEPELARACLTEPAGSVIKGEGKKEEESVDGKKFRCKLARRKRSPRAHPPRHLCLPPVARAHHRPLGGTPGLARRSSRQNLSFAQEPPCKTQVPPPPHPSQLRMARGRGSCLQ